MISKYAKENDKFIMKPKDLKIIKLKDFCK